MSTVPVPVGWPTVRLAYDGITTKLSAPGTIQQKKDAIAYWMARLNEDLALISKGKPPATAPTSPPAPY